MIPQKQGSPEWLRWRNDKLGASDAAAILGISAFKSIGALWEEKLGIRGEEEENEHMKRGKAQEDEARECFEKLTGLCMTPKVCVHPTIEYMIASLDGISMDDQFILEIKCPGQKDHSTALNGEIPRHYVPQLQHIMAVTGHQEIFYFSYRNGQGKILKHQRNEHVINDLIEKQSAFWALYQQGKEEIERHDVTMDTLKENIYRIIQNGDSTT